MHHNVALACPTQASYQQHALIVHRYYAIQQVLRAHLLPINHIYLDVSIRQCSRTHTHFSIRVSIGFHPSGYVGGCCDVYCGEGVGAGFVGS